MKKIHNIVMNPQQINLNPTNELEEIMQNINTLLCTLKYSVPLYRDFGLEATFLDRPTLISQAKLSSEIYKNIQKYEPRVKVEGISYLQGGEGGEKLIPKVQVTLK